MSFWKKTLDWFRKEIKLGLYLRIETKTGTIIKVTTGNFDANFNGTISGIIIEDFVKRKQMKWNSSEKINKKSLAVIEDIKYKNINWKEFPLHRKEELKRGVVKFKWNAIKGYLI